MNRSHTTSQSTRTADGQIEFGFCRPPTLPRVTLPAVGVPPWWHALNGANDNDRLRLVEQADGILRRHGVIRPVRRRLRAIGLFDGIGAHELAAARLGLPLDFLARAEIAAAQSAILAARFPGGVNLGDVMADDFVERARAVCPDGYDLAVATPPCIDFSVGGKRRGIDAEHGRLTLRTADILENNGVRYWLIENVPNLLSSNGGHDFGKLLARLAGADHDLVHPAGSWTSLGYVVGPHRHVAWRIVDAQHFGLPQRRRRVFILVTPDESALNIFN